MQQHSLMTIISPAKSLDFSAPVNTELTSECRFLEQAADLVDVLKTYSLPALKHLMSISSKLAELNLERFSQWQLPITSKEGRQALLAFKGDVYQGLDAASLNDAALHQAQQKLRILSGLYGLLRPMDLILPYRLEMGTKLETSAGHNLYQWWGGALTQQLSEDMQANNARALVNLASKEYAQAIDFKLLSVPVIEPEFRDWKNGQYKIISFFAKKARGMMVRFMLDHDIRQVEDVKSFDVAGYRFDSSHSTDSKWLFLRKQS